MRATEHEKRLYGNGVRIISRDENCIQYDLSSEEGAAVMTSYKVFPGIDLVYNDIHKQQVSVDTDAPNTVFEINHCREGRIECEFNRGEYLYIARGDLVTNLKSDISKNSTFPLSHYHGITIAIDLEQTTSAVFQIFDDVKINLYQLREKLCGDRGYTIMRENEKIQHIFSELYDVPLEIRQGYFKLKVMEILLVLSVIEKGSFHKRYYLKKQVDVIKQIKVYLTSHLEQKITIEQLSKQFEMPETTMKLVFKEVYGNSIYAFIKEYKMQRAAILLKETNYTIGEIAIRLGYDNASKFSEAFKKSFGKSPRDYRNS